MRVKQAIKVLKDHPYSVWEQCIGYEVLYYISGNNDRTLKKIANRKVESISCNNDSYTILIKRRKLFDR